MPPQGICYYDAERRSFYDGEWVRGQRHGWGIMVYESGNRYEGVDFSLVGPGLSAVCTVPGC